MSSRRKAERDRDLKCSSSEGEALAGASRLRIVLIAFAAILAGMVVFPPFHVVYAPGIEIHTGYGFILDPPVFWERFVSTVDTGTLSVQVAGVAFLACAVSWFVQGGTK